MARIINGCICNDRYKLEKWSCALSLFSTIFITTATFLYSETYQRNNTFTLYRQGSTNIYHVSQPAPAVQVPLCNSALPVAPTLSGFILGGIWMAQKPTCPHLQASSQFLTLPHSEKTVIAQEPNYQQGNTCKNIFGQGDKKYSTFTETSQKQESGPLSWMLLVLFPL